jgi:hypothetical protein
VFSGGELDALLSGSNIFNKAINQARTNTE